MHKRAFLETACCLLLAAAPSPACVGGQTGDGEPSDDGRDGHDNGGPSLGSENGAGCTYETETLDDLEATGELGFSPRQVIEAASGTFATTFAWQASEQLELGPETGTSELTMTIAYDGGEVRIRRPRAREQDTMHQDSPTIGLGEIDRACPVAYEIDVQLELRTAGGAFDESLETMLVASVPDVARFHQPIDHEALQGSFEVLGTQPRGGVVKQVYVAGTLSPLGTYGSVSGVLEYTTTGGPGGGAVSDVAVSGGGLIGSWPASTACNEDYGAGLSVAAGADLGGRSLSDAIGELNALFPRGLTWQVPAATPTPPEPSDDPQPTPDPDTDGAPAAPGASAPAYDDVSETTIELSVEPVSEGCARLENGRWRLSLPVALSAATEDGELQAAYEGELTALSGPEGLSEPSVRAGMDNVPVASFEASTGVSGVDVTGYDYGRVSLSLDLQSAAGSLEVQGADVADCVTNPPEPMRDENGNIVGSAGCRGTDFITLRRAVF